MTSVPAAFAANSWNNSPVATLLVQDDGTSVPAGLVVVIMPTDMAYVPVCHVSAARNRFYVDLSRGPAKAQYSMLLAAMIAGRSVNIALNESCLSGIALLRNVDIVAY